MTFVDIVNKLVALGNRIVITLISIAFIVLVIGFIKYLSNQDNSKDKAALRHILISGVGGMFVIVSLWGLVNLIGGIFGIL
jgi:hypothetical protein